VFHGLSFGKIGQPPIVGLPAKGSPPCVPVPVPVPAPPAPGAGPPAAPRTLMRTIADLAHRERRHGRTR
jgi:hypothetical protein